MADAYDPSALFGDPDADARANAMRRLGMLGQLSGDRVLAPAGKNLEDEANTLREIQLGAPQRFAQTVQARRAGEEEEARHNPLYSATLRGVLGKYGVQVPENTPYTVMENVLPTAEKYAQAQLMARARTMGLLGKTQDKFDKNTGEHYIYEPATGATYTPDGRLRTPGVRGADANWAGESSPIVVQPPTQEPDAQPASMAAPRLIGPADRASPSVPGPTPAAPGPQVRKLSRSPAPASPVSSGPVAPPAPAGEPAPVTLDKAKGVTLLPASAAYKSLKSEEKQARDTLTPQSKASGDLYNQWQKISAANVLDTLMTHPDGSLVDLTSQQQREAATALARMIIGSGGGGGMSQGQIEELDAPSLKRWLAERVQWMSSQPQGSGAFGMFQNILDTAHREKEQAQAMMRKTIADRVSQFPLVVKHNPALLVSLLKPMGFTGAEFDASGNYTGTPIGLTPVERAKAEGAKTEQKPAAAPVRKTIGGKTYEKRDGQWFEVQ